MTESSTDAKSSVSENDSPFAAFKEYTDNIRRYLRTGTYADGLHVNAKRAIRKATSSGQYSLEGRSKSLSLSL